MQIIFSFDSQTESEKFCSQRSSIIKVKSQELFFTLTNFDRSRGWKHTKHCRDTPLIISSTIVNATSTSIGVVGRGGW